MTIRLLLVDDHRMMREGLRNLLEAHGGFEVLGEAGDGREAVELARALRPDIVIMDLGMKELNGVEATRQIRAEFPQIRVVVLSTHSGDDYVLNALEAGASAYVLKIGAHQELVDALQTTARGRSYLSPEITSTVVEARVQGGLFSKDASREPLTPREREVLQLVAEGRSSGAIAGRLYLSTRTVEQHRRHIMGKLDLHSVADLTRYAVRHGIASLED